MKGISPDQKEKGAFLPPFLVRSTTVPPKLHSLQHDKTYKAANDVQCPCKKYLHGHTFPSRFCRHG